MIIGWRSSLPPGLPAFPRTWARAAAAPTPRPSATGPAYGISAARACNGKIYVIGNNVNYEYNPNTNTWATKTAAPTTQKGHAVTIGSDQRIYLVNDRNYNTSSDPIIYAYRWTNDTWYQRPNTVKGYTLPAVAHLSKHLYLTGGTVRFSPQGDRLEKSSTLATCVCWGNTVLCFAVAEPIKFRNHLRIQRIDGPGIVVETPDTWAS